MRQQNLQHWCNNYFKREVALIPLSGDASFRRYFRIVENTQSWIVADAPPTSEKNAEFVYVSQLLNAAQILAPKVLAYDAEQGFLLLNDLGDQTLLPLLNSENADGFYTQSMRLISAMQKLDCSALPAYDQTSLLHEMELFPRWFIGELLEYDLSASERDLIDALFAQLVQSALQQPQVFVHRDFHSRNIMVLDQQVATIDFQDAVRGAISYDLVSLLRDCYIDWPQERVATWLDEYYQWCQMHGLIAHTVSVQQFTQWFDWMGLQRHIKVLGIFARLSIRDNKHGYLLDLPLVIKYVRTVLAMYPQQKNFQTFLSWFDTKLVPRLATKEWIKGRGT